MNNSEKLFERSSKVFPKGVNSPVRYYPPYPVFIERGEGSRMWDADGKEYLDFVLAYGPLILGHAPKEVVEAVKGVMDDGTLYGAPTELEVKFGELITRSASLDKIRLTNSGTEATMHAIRLARYVTGRKKVLKIVGGYHGAHPYNFDSEYVESVEFNEPDAAREKLSGKEFACMIVEPVMGNVGVVNPEEGYLDDIREATEKTGTLLIMDEVITGFRTGFYPFYKREKVRPDITTFAKIIGGGFPLAAYGGDERIMKEVRPEGEFPQAGTYSGNPVSVAAGLKTMEILSKKDYSYLSNITRVAAGSLSGSGLTVNYQPGMLSLFFTDRDVRRGSDVFSSRKDLYFKWFRKALELGFYIPPSYDETIFLSFAHRQNEVRGAFEILADEAKRIWKERSK